MRRAEDYELLNALKQSLQGLNDLKVVPHNDPRVLRLKQHIREKIREMESEDDCEQNAA